MLTTDGTTPVASIETSWTITKRTLLVEWIGGNSSSIYDGLNHNVTVRLSGIQGGDYVSFGITTNYEVYDTFIKKKYVDYNEASKNVGI